MDQDASGLLAGAAGGDAASWNALVERFSGLLWSIARSYRLSDADAADVLQTTWLRLLEHLERIDDPTRVGAWLATVTRHEIHRLHRAAARARTVPGLDGPLGDALTARSAPNPGPESTAVAADRDRLLWEAFAELTDRCQELLRLVVTGRAGGETLSYREASVTLGVPIGSLGPTRARCLAELRNQVARRGISGEPDDS